MARTDPQVNFRIPSELKDQLENAAKENGRTLTAELILRLESTFSTPEQNHNLQSKIDTLELTVERLTDEFDKFKKHIGYIARK